MKPWSEQTIPQLEKKLKEMNDRISHDSGYCSDDPGGYLRREVLKMENEASQLQIYILRRKNEELEKRVSENDPRFRNLVILDISDRIVNHLRVVAMADLVIQVDTVEQEFIVVKNRYGKQSDDFIPVSQLPKFLNELNEELRK